MLSAAFSRIHVLPPLVVFKRTPLPPAAQASSYMMEAIHKKLVFSKSARSIFVLHYDNVRKFCI